MSHYILPNGPFGRAFEKMLKAYRLPFVYKDAYLPALISSVDDEEEAILIARLTQRKVKYTCVDCKVNV